ncbi:MAG TPA: T9SS type A sorting domain-containing protein, partial [Flavisolibacter sp.]|nr:T9SS type A sorting domain-containing protein [Flavisolibacter sp.]
ANAGINQNLTLPVNSTSLIGGGNDVDGTIVKYQWNQVSGPSTATITTPGASQTSVGDLEQGVYIFELQVTDDDGATGSATVQITVNAPIIVPNQSPIANAGSSQTIILPVNKALLQGSGTDPDGIIAGYQWTQISGPSSAKLSAPSAAQTEISALEQGVYTFELKVTDNDGATGKATVKVIVLSAPASTQVDVFDLAVYPNPAKSKINAQITMSRPGGSYYVNIYNAGSGQRVYQSSRLFPEPHGIVTIDVSNLSAGCYFIQLVFADERKIESKFIKE